MKRITCVVRCLCLYLFSLNTSFSHSWYITPPQSKKDWEGVAALVVQAFEEPSENDVSVWERAKWNLVEKKFTEAWTYRRYVSTARKMRGTKYAILVAKHWGSVIGMAELGVRVENEEEGGDRRPIIGVLCVAPEFRQQRVGQELVDRSLKIAAEHWRETEVFAEVEPENTAAISFFQSCGFTAQNNRTVLVNLQGRGPGYLSKEYCPHRLLRKQLHILGSSREEEEAQKRLPSHLTEQEFKISRDP